MTVWRQDLELAITLHTSVYECNFYNLSEYLMQSDFLYGCVNLLGEQPEVREVFIRVHIHYNILLSPLDYRFILLCNFM